MKIDKALIATLTVAATVVAVSVAGWLSSVTDEPTPAEKARAESVAAAQGFDVHMTAAERKQNKADLARINRERAAYAARQKAARAARAKAHRTTCSDANVAQRQAYRAARTTAQIRSVKDLPNDCTSEDATYDAWLAAYDRVVPDSAVDGSKGGHVTASSCFGRGLARVCVRS